VVQAFVALGAAAPAELNRTPDPPMMSRGTTRRAALLARTMVVGDSDQVQPLSGVRPLEQSDHWSVAGHMLVHPAPPGSDAGRFSIR
jgi:hypothetical protein